MRTFLVTAYVGVVTDEVEPTFDREWIEFYDPADSETVVRANLTWLTSRWNCIFGQGCPGIDFGQPADGCCLHGAFFTDEDDVERVRRAAQKLTPETWQLHRDWDEVLEDDTLENEDGVEEPAVKTAVVDGACVFHNRAGFETGPGCALHQQAMRDGVHPMDYKPEVCWQLPVKRDFTSIDRADGSVTPVTIIDEFDRASWGPGGHDFHWWCTDAKLAHKGAKRVYQSYEPELTAMLGASAYQRLAEICDQSVERGLQAPHPADPGE